MAMSSSTQVGFERLGHAHRAFAVMGGADQMDVLDPGEQHLQPLGSERLVIGDQDFQARCCQSSSSNGMASETS